MMSFGVILSLAQVIVSARAATDGATSAFSVAPGFRVELVASEPLVESPVTLSFDEDGRLWVVELVTYMNDVRGTGERAARNRVVVLDDQDGDGVMDRRTVFLDGLVLPRGAVPCRGGALVIEPPWITFAQDLDGDGRADTMRRLVDGFAGLDNPEHAGNGPIYGLDNCWEFSQHDVRIRFDGERVETEPTPGHGQWGIARDDVGRLYYSPNSQPMLVDVLPKACAKRNPRMTPTTLGSWIGRSIADDTTVWPLVPTPGVNRGYQENVLRADGTLANFTGACAPCIVRTDALGAHLRGNAFVCEAAGNLVARFAIDEVNGVPKARRDVRDTEFLRSRDERFRPVATALGPDGALYVADIARGVIQHRVFLTDYLKGQIASRQLEAPLSLGRIWRVVPDGWKQPTKPQLSAASNVELVAYLSHENGWWRDTAQRLLVERRAMAMIPALRELLTSAPWPIARAHALWTLAGIGGLTTADVATAATDHDANVREQAMRAAARITDPASLEPLVWKLAREDPSRLVRAAAALASAAFAGDETRRLRVEVLFANADDRLVREAMLVAMDEGVSAAFDEAMVRAVRENKARLDDLGAAIVRCALRGTSQERSRVTQRLAESGALLAELEDAVAQAEFRGRRLTLSEPPPSIVDGTPDISRIRAVLEHFTWPGDPRTPPQVVAAKLDGADLGAFDRGRALFTACAACHRLDGSGTAGQAPSLIGSSIASGEPDRLIRALLHGLTGGRSADGSPWPTMTPLALNNDELADVMTYVRHSFGMAASRVHADDVAALRAAHLGRVRPWTREELERAP